MSDDHEDRLDLELVTTALLAREEDLPMLLQMLAGQLAVSLPDQLTVEREGGMFRKSERVRSLQVTIGAEVFGARVDKGRVTSTIAKMSGGIRIRSETLGMDDWIRRLLAALRAEAAHNQKARATLETIVYGGFS